MKKNTQIYRDGDVIVAIVVKKNFTKPGMIFFTPEEFPQQLAYVRHKKEKVIAPHIHNKFKRNIAITQEVLVIRKGNIEISLYTHDKKLLKTFILSAGDVILFASGGHGYKVLKDTEIILIKQGPYAFDKDKVYLD